MYQQVGEPVMGGYMFGRNWTGHNHRNIDHRRNIRQLALYLG